MILLLFLGNIFIRLLPHLPNFTPVTATALFGGVYLKKRYAFIIPLSSMAVSDYLLLYFTPFRKPLLDISHIYPLTAMVHSTIIYVYIGFILSGLLGLILRRKKTLISLTIITFLASLQFFLITNFGVWAGGMYSRDIHGLIESYFMGIPFFRYALMGDFFYTFSFFAIYEFVYRRFLQPTISGRIKVKV